MPASRRRLLDASPRQLGLYIFFGSLTVLFGASIVAYLITRAQTPMWRAPGMAGLPSGLWLSTALALSISASLESARRAVRANRSQALTQRLWLALILVVAFLLAQVENWMGMRQTEQSASVQSLFPYTFYLLTGLHALHVLGGLVPLTLTLVRAVRREYSSSNHEGLNLCSQYWHFLGIVWVVLFTTLELGA